MLIYYVCVHVYVLTISVWRGQLLQYTITFADLQLNLIKTTNIQEALNNILIHIYY